MKAVEWKNGDMYHQDVVQLKMVSDTHRHGFIVQHCYGKRKALGQSRYKQ